MFYIETLSSTADRPLFVALNNKLPMIGQTPLKKRGFRLFRWTTDRQKALSFDTIEEAEFYLQSHPSLIGATVISWEQNFLLPEGQSSGECPA